MLNNKRIKQFLTVILLVSMLPVFYTAANRIKLEESAKQVEIVIDTEEIYLKAIGYGTYQNYLLALEQFKEAGATTATLYQKTIKLLNERGDITVFDYPTAADFMRAHPESQMSLLMPEGLRPMHHYLLIEQGDNFSRLKYALKNSIDNLNWSVYENKTLGILEMPSAYFDLYENAGLWYDLEEMQEYLDLGFYVQLRPADLPGQTKEDFTKLYAPIVALGQVSGVIVTGTNLPGTQDLTGKSSNFTAQGTAFEAFSELLKEQGWYYGLVETMTQLDSLHLRGDSSLLQRLDFQAVRVYSIQRAELDKIDWLSQKSIEERWLRGAVDRNMRVVYLRLFENKLNDPQQILELNKAIVTGGRKALEQAGFTIGLPSVLSSFHLVGQVLLLPLALALSAVLFLMTWFNGGKPILWLGLLLLSIPVALAAGYLARSNGAVGGSWVSYRQMLALGAQVLYPALAGILTMKALDKMVSNSPIGNKVGQGVILSLFSFIVVFAGGLVLGTILSDNTFMLELQYFRGVKLGFVLPLIILGIYYFYRYGFTYKPLKGRRKLNDMVKDLQDLLKATITVEMAFFSLLAAGALFYYILRSGNASVSAISGLELKMRSFLERVLVARPRNKEFLIGYPVLMLMPRFAAGKRPFIVGPLLALATVGWVSVVNSFAHVRSTLLISMNRGIWGLALGIVFGLILNLALSLVDYLYKKFVKEA